MKVINLGIGYVGLNTAAALAWIGHDVCGVDIDPAKIEMLKNGCAPIREEGLDALLKQATRLKYTTDISGMVNEADVIFIAVGTPSLPNGHANLEYVNSAAKNIAMTLMPTHDVTIVIKSTVPLGINAAIERRIRGFIAQRGGDVSKLHFASNPEFLREGCALSDTFYPDRIVIGTDDDVAFRMLSDLYAPLLNQSFAIPPSVPAPANRPKTQLLRTNQTSAEMIKYASNVFLALKISYINEISGLCEKLGADITDVATGMGMDKRIAPYFLKSGLGWGGSCFPKDIKALLQIGGDYGYEMPIIKAAWDVNENQKHRVIRQIQEELKIINGKKIAFFGLTFKPNTDDVRNSPAVDLANMLIALGADVVFHDPVGLANAKKIYADAAFTFADTPVAAAKDADALIITTEWKDYAILDYAEVKRVMKSAYIFDTRHVLNETAIRNIGFVYRGC